MAKKDKEVTDQVIKMMRSAKNSALKSSGLSQIFLKRENFASNAVSTGSVWLDYKIGGGIPPGRIVGISGPEHSGKSLFVTEILRAQLEASRFAEYFDAEGGTDPLFLKARGINFEDYIGARDKNGSLKPEEVDYIGYYQPTTGEEVVKHIHSLLTNMPENRSQTPPPVIFALDSVVALISESVSEDIDANRMAMHARMYSENMPIIQGLLSKTGCSFVYVNQLRQKPGVQYGAPEYEPCFVGDVRIATDNGLIRIEDALNEKPKVISGDYIESTNCEWVYTGRKETIIVCLRNGMRLEVTPNHLVTTTEGDIEARDLLGKRVLLTAGGAFGKELDDVDVGMLLGWTTGDGWLTAFDDQNCKFGVCFGPDDYLARAKIIEILSDRYGIIHPIRAKGKRATVDSYTSGKQVIINDFKKWGWHPARANKKRVPEIIFRSSREVVSAYLGALFSADGTVSVLTKKGRDSIRLSTASEWLARDVQLLLIQFSVMSSIIHRPRHGFIKFKNCKNPSERKEYWDVLITGESMQTFKECIGFTLSPHKQAKLHQARWMKAKEFTAEVVSIENGVSDRHVYDVKEPLTNHVYANGILSHNCGDALKFFSAIRLRLKGNKPKLLGNDHPFIDGAYNPKVTPKAGGIYIESHLENGVKVGEDRAIYTAITSIKNKVYTPQQVCWVRIVFDECGSTGRGLDPAFDTFSFLYELGMLAKAKPNKEKNEKKADVAGLFEVPSSSKHDLKKLIDFPWGAGERFSYHDYKNWAWNAPGIIKKVRDVFLVTGLAYELEVASEEKEEMPLPVNGVPVPPISE